MEIPAIFRNEWLKLQPIEWLWELPEDSETRLELSRLSTHLVNATAHAELVSRLNGLEGLAAYFTHDLADADLGWELLGKSLLELVENDLVFSTLITSRAKCGTDFEEIVALYRMWLPRSKGPTAPPRDA